MQGHNSRPWVRGRPVEEYKLDVITGCWIWLRPFGNGAGAAYRPGHPTRRAHRVYFQEAYGEIPEGKKVVQVCGNEKCVNPEHLEAVSQSVVVRRSSRTTLSSNDVLAIRFAVASGESLSTVASRYAVTPTRIWQLARGPDRNKHFVDGQVQ